MEDVPPEKLVFLPLDIFLSCCELCGGSLVIAHLNGIPIERPIAGSTLKSPDLTGGMMLGLPFQPLPWYFNSAMRNGTGLLRNPLINPFFCPTERGPAEPSVLPYPAWRLFFPIEFL